MSTQDLHHDEDRTVAIEEGNWRAVAWLKNRDELVAGLRAMADFYESAPTYYPLPFMSSVVTTNGVTAEMLKQVIRYGKPWRKDSSDEHFRVVKDFSSSVGVTYWTARDEVCERRQVGTEIVPEQVIPAKEKPIYEYDCDPILDGADDDEVAT